tara:strand:- start:307 stop:432 length:126 start_codon:yes stop_codon:yes gene_type:complete
MSQCTLPAAASAKPVLDIATNFPKLFVSKNSPKNISEIIKE